MSKPNINVTPLIDVLLVLLIIFMVVTPLKPSTFKARIPDEPKDLPIKPDTPPPLALVIALEKDNSLRLNHEDKLGTPDDPEKLIKRLAEIFRMRKENDVAAENLKARIDTSDQDVTEKTVFVKASPKTGYGSVAQVVDAVKRAGANPISLQIDDLTN